MKRFHYVAAKQDEYYVEEFKISISRIRKEYASCWIFLTADINDTCDIEVLFLSNNFLNVYIDDFEELMQRRERKEVLVIPILTRPCDFSKTPLEKLQGVPRSGKALSQYKNLDEALYGIAKEIADVLKKY